MRLTADGIDFDAPAGWPWTRAFAAAFETVWERLPRNVRNMLLHAGVSVQLVEEIASHENRNVWAESHEDGVLLFARRFCEALPRTILEVLIAHEMAHAFRRGVGAARWNSDEEATDALTESWGFDAKSLRQYSPRGETRP